MWAGGGREYYVTINGKDDKTNRCLLLKLALFCSLQSTNETNGSTSGVWETHEVCYDNSLSPKVAYHLVHDSIASKIKLLSLKISFYSV